MLKNNEFGELVQSYRKMRGWTQEELAERWGHSRAYLAQVERGKRKLDSASQVVRLADILDIPTEKLEAIGRGIPERKIKSQSPAQSDDAILQMLLAPGRDMVKLSYMVWLADRYPNIEEQLEKLILNLDQALTSYHGEFVKPAQQLLAYAHQMQGEIAFDRLDFTAAGGHFSEMIDLGNELNDPDIITLGMVHQGDVLRKRGRYETALRCFEAAKPIAETASIGVQGVRHIIIARAHYCFGNEQQFLRAIDPALEIASRAEDTINNLFNEYNYDEALQEQAVGFTMLWKPEKAIEIYKETDKLRPFRPLRENGSYIIDKARAFLHLGDLEQGTELSLKGIELASEYQSKRHIARIDVACRRLGVTPTGKDKRLITLREALAEAHKKQATW